MGKCQKLAKVIYMYITVSASLGKNRFPVQPSYRTYIIAEKVSQIGIFR